jgi:hypothetical protein
MAGHPTQPVRQDEDYVGRTVVVVVGGTELVVVGRGTVVVGRAVVGTGTVAGARGRVVGGNVGNGLIVVAGAGSVVVVVSTEDGGAAGAVDTVDLRLSSSTDAVYRSTAGTPASAASM